MSSYIPGDSLFGGNTYTANDVEPTLEAYENVFGPAGRDVKLDQMRHRRRGRWHLPDILKGPNQYLTDRVDGLITDPKNSPFTTFILPYKQIDSPDAKIKWNVWSFDEGLASRVPYESAARTLTQSKRSFKGFAVRHGLALNLEHNFMMSEAGRRNFHNQLNQLIGSIQMTNDWDVHVALLMAPSYEKHMKEKYILDTETPSQKCRQFVDLFGYMQKNVNALDILIEEAKGRLKSWGSELPNFMLANSKLTFGLQMTPERTNYQTQGPEGIKRLKQGPEIDSYRGINIIHSRSFSVESGTPPRDVLRRRVRVAEYYRIPPSQHNYNRSFEFYNEDRDTWFSMSFNELLKHAVLGDASPDDELLRTMSMLSPNQAMDTQSVRPQTTGDDRAGNSVFANVDLAVSRDMTFTGVGGGIFARAAPEDFVYASGYRNPSMNRACQLNCNIPAAARNYSRWVEAGIVRKSQHGLQEFFRVVAKDKIQPDDICKAFRVYQQLGQCNLSNRGGAGAAGDFSPANRFRSLAPVYPINYDENFVLLHNANDPLAATNLCPNWFIPNNAYAGNKWEALASRCWTTDEMNKYFLGSLNGSDAGADYRQTLLYQLVMFPQQHTKQFKEFQTILQNVDLGHNYSRKRAAKNFSGAIKKTRQGLTADQVTLARLVYPHTINTTGTAAGGYNAWTTNLIDNLYGWNAPTFDTVETLGGEPDDPIDWNAPDGPLDDATTQRVLLWFAYRYFGNRLQINDANRMIAPAPPATATWDVDLNKDFYEPPAEDDPNHEAMRQRANVEIVIVRPNIEHNMFGIILGRGGDQLGNTFWGQTELSCYDDAQHGIWGMSYKYHERAIVINERNLIRLWDVAYDGYVGGKDDRVVQWNAPERSKNSHHEFKEATRNVSKNYHGPSMMVMAFIHRDADTLNDRGAAQNWPSPIVFHDQSYFSEADAEGLRIDPEGAHAVQTGDFRVFNREIPAYATRYDQYFAKMPDFTRMALQRKPVGAASSENEVCSDMLAFQGSMRILRNDGVMHSEINGSGHHGNDFVGVASLRAGKGYRIQSQPTLSRAA